MVFFLGCLRVPTRRCDLVVPANWGWGRSNMVGGSSQDHDFLSLGLGRSLSPAALVPEINIKTYFDMKVRVSVWRLPPPDQDIKCMINSDDGIGKVRIG